MPMKLSPDSDERAEIEAAISRLRREAPRHPKLLTRAQRGSLKINLNTVATDSGVARHRIVSLYPDLAKEVISASGERGSSVPLRKQLDVTRRLKAGVEKRLELSRSYNFRLLERLSQLGVEVQRLNERIEELETELAGDTGKSSNDLIGTGLIVGVPPAAAPKKRRQPRSFTA